MLLCRLYDKIKEKSQRSFNDVQQTSTQHFPCTFSGLKRQYAQVIACIAMLIDHTGAIILKLYPPALNTLFYINGKGYSAYRVVRDIGRCAFPIFCFLIVEGFLHTHDRRKYGRNLLLFALISEIPWNYMFANTWHYADKQNVFFTLFLGYLAFCALEYFWETPWMQLASLLALLGISIVLHADYGWRGFIFLVLMYLLRNEKVSQAIVGTCWLSYEWKACFAFISINSIMENAALSLEKAAEIFLLFILSFTYHDSRDHKEHLFSFLKQIQFV